MEVGQVNCLQEVFGKPKVFLPVVHIQGEDYKDQSLRNTMLAQDAGADGVFLISHNLSAAFVIEALNYIRSQIGSEFWIGINFLDLDPIGAFQNLPINSDGLWNDNARMSSTLDHISAIDRAKKRANEQGRKLYFGGVEFKYQTREADLGLAIMRACNHMDVITTSGPGTGQAASVSKIKEFRMIAGPEMPIAIASGTSEENAHQFTHLADVFIVASSIERQWGELDPNKTKTLAKIIHNQS